MAFVNTSKRVFYTHDDEMDMLEKIEHVEPCRRAQEQFDSVGSIRRVNLSFLKAPKGHCVWCDKKLTGRQQRWCSSSCASYAFFLANPQSPAARAHRLIFKQNWACKICGLSFEDELRSKIRRHHRHQNTEGAWIWRSDYKKMERNESDPEYKVSFHFVGNNTGDRIQTDHIIPIHKGGAGLDPNNLQVICVDCHKVKTIEERRG